MTPPSGTVSAWFRSSLVLLALLASDLHTLLAQETCTPVRLDQARMRYELGVLPDVLDLLRPCVPLGFESSDDRAAAFRLMALSYLAIDSTAQSRFWIERMIQSDPSYQINQETDPPRFVVMVNQAKPKWYTWLWKGRSWSHWLGRTAILAGAVSAPLVIRRLTAPDPVTAPDPDLPLPPDFPARN